MKASLAHEIECVVQRRHYRCDHDSIDLVEMEAFALEEVLQICDILVAVFSVICNHSPFGDQILTSKDSKRDVCVSGVNHQKHRRVPRSKLSFLTEPARSD